MKRIIILLMLLGTLTMLLASCSGDLNGAIVDRINAITQAPQQAAQAAQGGQGRDKAELRQYQDSILFST